ncbi:MAG: hypothetical protein ABH832_02410 [bacterium]
MKITTTKITVASIMVVFLFALAVCANAAPNINEFIPLVGQTAGFDTAVTDTTLSQTVGKIIKSVLAMVGTVFLALTVYAGLLWMTAGGKEESVEKAIKIFRTSLIGLIIVVTSYSITVFVLSAIFVIGSSGSSAGGAGGSNNNWVEAGTTFHEAAGQFWNNFW